MKILNKLTPHIPFVASLFFMTVIFYMVRHFMIHLDEFDNIVSPYLMSQGKKFYLDIFNMQFPLSFYWANLFVDFWVNSAPVRALSVFRMSLVTYYLLTSFFVYISFKNNKTRIAYSTWLFLFSILVPLYHGNLFVTETFNTVAIASLFWLIIPIFIKLEKFTNYHFFASIIFISLSFWSQPLLIFLALIPFTFLPKHYWVRYITFSILVNILPLLYFLINGQIVEFFRQTVFFNLNTYSNFFPEQVSNQNMFTQNVSVFFNNQIFIFTHLDNYTRIFQFFSQISFITFVFYFVFQKKYSALLSLLIFFVIVHIREIKIVPGQIFIFAIFPYLAISSASAFLLFFSTKKYRIFSMVLVIILFASAFGDFYPIFKQSLVQGRNYDEFWSYRQRIGEDISLLTKPEDKILIYPYESDLYFFSRRRPFDRFIYWFPWLASNPEFSQERYEKFISDPPILIYYHQISYKGDPLGYQKLWPNLLDNYRQIHFNCQPTSYWLLPDDNRSLPPNYSYSCAP